ncbi:MAG: GxxExxY protein [Candidatus Edwardsbacteria bacterium]|jgi:GxxExxY protein|nr:GxxExxY protein [Candidatus Edwardsbacteria bacterium]
MDTEDVAKNIVDAAYQVHSTLGPGLLEAVYQRCLLVELKSKGLNVQCEVPLPIMYRNVRIDTGYRMDMIVEGCIVVENKSIDAILPVHKAQLITYLKLSGHPLGFLINWNVALIKDGIHRLINKNNNKS